MTKVPFFCNLPADVVKEINRRAKLSGLHQWEVVANAVRGTVQKYAPGDVVRIGKGLWQEVSGGPRRKTRGEK